MGKLASPTERHLKGLPWAAVFFSEIEPFPNALLAHHYPEVPNLGDFTKIKGKDYAGKIDVLSGGTPCQAFSLQGHRGGLQDPRGRLMLAFVGLARDARVPWLVWENVTGVLSQDQGRAFAQFLSLLTGQAVEPPKHGWKTFGIATPASPDDYGVCWRVLDAQYCRVDQYPLALPQRRRRVWLVAHRADWQGPARVLYEPPSNLEIARRLARWTRRKTPPLVAKALSLCLRASSRTDASTPSSQDTSTSRPR